MSTKVVTVLSRCYMASAIRNCCCLSACSLYGIGNHALVYGVILLKATLPPALLEDDQHLLRATAVTRG